MSSSCLVIAMKKHKYSKRRDGVLGTTLGVLFNRIMMRMSSANVLEAIKSGKFTEPMFVKQFKEEAIRKLQNQIEFKEARLKNIKSSSEAYVEKEDISNLKKTIAKVNQCKTAKDLTAIIPDDRKLNYIEEAFRLNKIREKAQGKKDSKSLVLKRKAMKRRKDYLAWRDDAVQEVTQERSKLLTMLTNLKNTLSRIINNPIVRKVISILSTLIKILAVSVTFATLYAKFKHSFGDNKTKQTFAEFLNTDSIPRPIRMLAKVGFAACISFMALLGKFVKLEGAEAKSLKFESPKVTSANLQTVKLEKHGPVTANTRVYEFGSNKEKILPKALKSITTTKTPNKVETVIKSVKLAKPSAVSPSSQVTTKIVSLAKPVKHDKALKRCKPHKACRVNDDMFEGLKSLIEKAKTGLGKFARIYPSIAKALRIILKIDGTIGTLVGGFTTSSVLFASLNDLKVVSREAEKNGAGGVVKMYIFPIIVLLQGILKLRIAKALTPEEV